ncbi:putative Integrase [Nitrospira japonica]|uniref:Putative Integrase n=1 Tax=Nitrospira japonica TaxID=1325564 RepID=A0A1W1I511_9BACT|nr:site-specific integrase [Nitrospira japonica]SLM48082.1 putative Integrase [Nitrospira japonica]
MGLVKRGNVWWMSFTYEGRQIRRSTETSDKRLAEAILGKVKVEIVEGKYFDKPREEAKTFLQLMERYLREHASRRMHYRRYVNMVDNLKAFFGNPKLHHVTPKTIVAFKNKRYVDGVMPATINRELAVLKKAFNLACREWEWTRDNPVCRVSMEREQNTRDRWLTEAEEGRLLKTALPWLRELILFAAHTGMRRGEILALNWNGVDFVRRTVTVFRSKNGERRTIPINQTVQDILTKRYETRGDASQTGESLVFGSEAQTCLDGSNLRRAFIAALKAAKIENLHFHDLRHTFATRLVQAGVDLYKVQRLLGHKSPSMTQRYAHHFPESLRDGVEILDRQRLISTISAQPAGGAMVDCVNG